MTPKDVPMIEALDEDRAYGCGTLTVTREEKRVALPLARVEISARAAGRVAQVTMRQAFRNPYPEPLEAVYIFPLRGGCAVSSFEMKVGDRIIRGKVEERQAARAHYERAVEQGKRAALLEQERDDVFTVQVGNVPPGQEVEVILTCSERLPFFENGTTELRLPLVVAPRYIPGRPLERESVGGGVEPDTDQVPDASRITPPRLVEGFDPQVALAIDVELADGEVADLACSQHATKTSIGAGGVKIALARKDELLDRDFVLRWRLAGETVRSTLLVSNGTAMLSIVPPRREGFLGVARDVVFVLDRSGSMSGVKMASAARACSILLGTLGPRDRFAIQAFDDQVEWLDSGRLVRADETGIGRGDRYLRGIGARGGTEMDGAIRAAIEALGKRKDTAGRASVVVLLTDGQVGNESQILKRIQKELGEARVFTVGIDTAVNEGFLKRLSALGGGTATFVVPGDALEEALRSVGREIGDPLVVDVKVEGADDPAPARMPDLFAGRAATGCFRMKGRKVRIRGRWSDGKAFDETVQAREIDLPAVAHLWARARVADLEDRYRLEPENQEVIKSEIVKLSIAHTLLTRFTAFVVVDESEAVNEDGSRRRIVQPVHGPAQWEMAEQMALPPMAACAPAGGAVFASTGFMPPAAPPPPPVMSKKRGLLGRAMDALRSPEPGKAAPSAAERSALSKKIEALARALDAARKEIEAGRAPSAEPIEKARAALLDELSGSEFGTHLPALQRFLRSAAVELVAALKTPGATAASLAPLFERHGKAFEEARKEFEKGGAFWEGTV